MSQVHNVTHVPVHSTAKKEGGPCGPPSSFAVDCAYPRPLCHTSLQLKPAEHRDFAHFSAGPVVGDYRREHLFTLGQSLTAFRHYQELIGACDREIEKSLETFESKVDPESPLRNANIAASTPHQWKQLEAVVETVLVARKQVYLALVFDGRNVISLEL